MKLKTGNQHQEQLNREDLEKKIVSLNEAIADSHENAQLYLQVGKAYEALKRYKEAIDAYSLFLFLAPKMRDIFLKVKLRIKIRKLNRKIENEETDDEAPLLNEIWSVFEGMVAILFLSPLWLAQIKRGFKADTPIFVYFFFCINVFLLYDAAKAIMGRFDYDTRLGKFIDDIKNNLTFSIIKVGVFSLAIPLGIYILSVDMGRKLELIPITFVIDKNIVLIYVGYIGIFLMGSIVQLLIVFIKPKCMSRTAKPREIASSAGDYYAETKKPGNETEKLTEIDSIEINSLDNPGYLLKRPFCVSIYKKEGLGERSLEENVFVADIEELDLFTFGKNKEQLIDELKTSLVDMYEHYHNINNETLDDDSRKWKKILCEKIAER